MSAEAQLTGCGCSTVHDPGCPFGNQVGVATPLVPYPEPITVPSTQPFDWSQVVIGGPAHRTAHRTALQEAEALARRLELDLNLEYYGGGAAKWWAGLGRAGSNGLHPSPEAAARALLDNLLARGAGVEPTP